MVDLTDKKIDWLKAAASKKYIDEEVKRLSNLPTGKAGEGQDRDGPGLDFGDDHTATILQFAELLSRRSLAAERLPWLTRQSKCMPWRKRLVGHDLPPTLT